MVALLRFNVNSPGPFTDPSQGETAKYRYGIELPVSSES